MLDTNPSIVTIDKPMNFLGLEIQTSNKTAFKDIPKLGRDYQAMKQKMGIPHQKDPWQFVAVARDYSKENRTFNYQMGNVVTKVDKIPEGFEVYEIPDGKYAVFTITPRFKFMWGRAILRTKQFAYTRWLPQSQYESAGTIDEFELHDERSLGKKPSIELYVAIKDKKI